MTIIIEGFTLSEALNIVAFYKNKKYNTGLSLPKFELVKLFL